MPTKKIKPVKAWAVIETETGRLLIDGYAQLRTRGNVFPNGKEIYTVYPNEPEFDHDPTVSIVEVLISPITKRRGK